MSLSWASGASSPYISSSQTRPRSPPPSVYTRTSLRIRARIPLWPRDKPPAVFLHIGKITRLRSSKASPRLCVSWSHLPLSSFDSRWVFSHVLFRCCSMSLVLFLSSTTTLHFIPAVHTRTSDHAKFPLRARSVFFFLLSTARSIIPFFFFFSCLHPASMYQQGDQSPTPWWIRAPSAPLVLTRSSRGRSSSGGGGGCRDCFKAEICPRRAVRRLRA